jgi:hypothetical protein
MTMSNNCVACGARYSGDNHHCSEEYENRRHAAENADRTDYDRRAYGTKLADGFAMRGCDDDS